jgi:hypothetical protein
MADIAIILDNVGNNMYAQASREFITCPVSTDRVKVLLDNASQIDNLLKIRNYKSFGSEWNRDVSLRQFISAFDKNSLIVDVILNPIVILDGQTYFETDVEANSEIDLLFYLVEQADISNALK